MKKYKKKAEDAKDENLNPSTRDGRPTVTQSIRGANRENEDEKEKEKKKEEGVVAVKGTSFGVKQGECFALLGVNGAGKSSTFNCITGYDLASGGSIVLDGENVSTYYKKPHLMHKLVGYCP